MAKYIDVESLVVAYSDHTLDDEFSKGVDFVLDLLDSKPPADVKPVVRGKWIIHDCGEATCPVCKTRQKNIWDYDGWQNFCGNCGADMRGENNG